MALEGKHSLFLFVFLLNSYSRTHSEFFYSGFMQDLTPLDYSQPSHTQERISRIQSSLQSMTPLDREKHLDAIERLLEGSASLVDIQLPKGAQTTRGRPAAKKLQKTEPRDPSGFEYVQPKKPKLQVKEDNKTQVKEEKKT